MTLLRIKLFLVPNSNSCLLLNVSSVDKQLKQRLLEVYPVRTVDFQNNILMICDERRDEWSAEVGGRIESVNDLHAADAVYHQNCSVNFRKKKAKPQTVLPEPERISKKGRPNTTDEYFQSVVLFLQQHGDEQVTIADLVEKMKPLCGEKAYSPWYMKKRLMDHFNDEIIIFDK